MKGIALDAPQQQGFGGWLSMDPDVDVLYVLKAKHVHWSGVTLLALRQTQLIVLNVFVTIFLKKTKNFELLFSDKNTQHMPTLPQTVIIYLIKSLSHQVTV